MNQFKKPTRLQELQIIEMLGYSKTLYEKCIVHSIKDSEKSCIVNLEVQYYNLRDNGKHKVRFERIIL